MGGVLATPHLEPALAIWHGHLLLIVEDVFSEVLSIHFDARRLVIMQLVHLLLTCHLVVPRGGFGHPVVRRCQ